MSRTKVLLLISVFGIAAIATVLLVTGDPDERPDLGPRPETPQENESDPALSPFLADGDEEESPERVTITGSTKTPPPSNVSPMPESYRRALAGIRGRLLRSDLTPLADTSVSLLELNLDEVMGSWTDSLFAKELQNPKIILGETKTGEDGRFLLKNAHAQDLHALGIDLGGPRGALRIIDEALHAGADTDLGDIILDPAVAITGTVVDPEGQVLENARVRFIPIPPMFGQMGIEQIGRDSLFLIREARVSGVLKMPSWAKELEQKLPFPTAMTDAQGMFRLDGVTPGIVSLVVDHPDLPAMIHGPVPTGRSEERNVGTIRLQAGRTVKGKVIDSEGQPVEGFQIAVGIPSFMISQIAIGKSAGLSGPDGSFSLANLPNSGTVLAAASRGESYPWHFSDSQGGDGELLIKVPADYSIRLNVVNEEGAPTPPDRLRWRVIPGGEEDFPPFLIPFRDIPANQISEEEDGIKISNVPPGAYSFLASAEGYCVSRTMIEVNGASAEGTMVLTRGREFNVLVTDGLTSAPVEYVDVSVSRDDEEPALAVGRTNDQGQLTLRVPNDEKASMLVRHPAYAPQVISDLSNQDIHCLLQSGAEIKGFVLERGRPPELPMMLFFEPRIEGRYRHPTTAMPILSITAPDGSFRVTGLPTGECRYTVQKRMFNQNAVNLMSEAMSLNSGDFMEIEEGTTTLVQGMNELIIDTAPPLPEDLATVQGVITTNLTPRPDFEVSFYHSEENTTKQAKVDDQGNFVLTAVPPGKSQIMVNIKPETAGLMTFAFGGGMPLHTEPLELSKGETKTLNIDLNLITAKFNLLNAGAGPRSGFLWLQPVEREEERGWESYSATEKDGVWIAYVPRPGEYRAAARFDKAVGQKVVNIPASGLSAPSTIELITTVDATGQCTLADGSIPSGGYMSASHKGPLPVGWTEDYETYVQLSNGAFTMQAAIPGTYEMTLHGEQQMVGELYVPEGQATGLKLILQPK